MLMTIPGIGPITAVSYVAALERPDSFKRSRAVGAWLGLTPRRFQSGEVDYHGHISSVVITSSLRLEPVAPFNCAAVSAGTPPSFDTLQPRIVQFAVNHERHRIPSKPAIPFQQRRWTPHAKLPLCEQFHGPRKRKGNRQAPLAYLTAASLSAPDKQPYPEAGLSRCDRDHKITKCRAAGDWYRQGSQG